MTKPIDRLLDQVEWIKTEGDPREPGCDLPYATHSGVLDVGFAKLRVYQLSNGMRVIDGEDMAALFDFVGAE